VYTSYKVAYGRREGGTAIYIFFGRWGFMRIE
jgi:hypothetical protein